MDPALDARDKNHQEIPQPSMQPRRMCLGRGDRAPRVVSATQLESPGVGAPHNTHAALPHLAAFANSPRIPLPLSAHISPHLRCREKHFVFLLIINHTMCPEKKKNQSSVWRNMSWQPLPQEQRAALFAHARVGCLSQTMAWCRRRCIRRTKAQGDTDNTHTHTPPPQAAPVE